MSIEENKVIVARCWRACFGGDLAVADELLVAAYQWHAPAQEVDSQEGIKELISSYRAGMPDLRWEVDDQLAEADKVATRWTMRGTHTGTLLGLAPTGKALTTTGQVISRLAGGQIVEEWEQFDQFGLFQQLGVIPAQEQPAPAAR
jgi:predicted ester cyclase